MSFFPDWIYRFTPRDEQVTPLEIVTVTQTAGAVANATRTTASYTVPTGRILILKHLALEAIPGAAQFMLRAETFILSVAPFSQTLTGITNTTTFTDRFLWGQSINVVVPSGGVINTTFTFNAGVAANNGNQYLTGLLIPRGNFAF